MLLKATSITTIRLMLICTCFQTRSAGNILHLKIAWILPRQWFVRIFGLYHRWSLCVPIHQVSDAPSKTGIFVFLNDKSINYLSRQNKLKWPELLDLYGLVFQKNKQRLRCPLGPCKNEHIIYLKLLLEFLFENCWGDFFSWKTL